MYEFSFIPPADDVNKSPILKYGISDLHRYSLNRPERQLAGLMARYGPSVKYRIIQTAINREHALAVELKKVGDHVNAYGEMPRAQLRPTIK